MAQNGCFLPRFAVWLIPRQADRTILQELITDLAGRFCAPEFIPHVTIYSGHRSLLQDELAGIAALARRCPQLTLCTDGLASGDRLTRTLFVRLRWDKTLCCLRDLLQVELGQLAPHLFEPHVSLLYQCLPLQVRNKLTRQIILPLQEISFDQVRVVAIPEEIDTPDKLSGWQPLLSCRLASNVINGTI